MTLGSGLTFGLMLRFCFLIIVALIGSTLSAQEQVEQRSENGWYLPPHDTIRVLVLFAEVDYDVSPDKDPQPNAVDHWPKRELPRWRDDLFDPFPLPVQQAMVSRYYQDISLGRYTVLGDYIDTILVLKESEYPGIHQVHSIGTHAVKEANKLGRLRTRHGLGIADLDLWKARGRPGLPKVPGPDDPHSYDHVMVIARNSGLRHGTGSTDSGSPGPLFGHGSDTQSRFGAMNGLPFSILRHEFNHLLLGGNNFHSGGGNAAVFQSYFITLQGGWSMMGGARSSLLTCSAWDRDRLGWLAEDACGRINARNLKGHCVNGDLDPLMGDTGIFVIRDMVTTGDALRIRMPFLDSAEYPQFLWLENHQGWHRNGSPTDRFHYELEMPCVQGVVPGIFAVMQVDRENKRGKDLFGGHADYLRALPASGFHDMRPRGDTVPNECLWRGLEYPLIVDTRLRNPLTGASELEIPLFDRGDKDVLLSKEDGIEPRIEVRDGRLINEAMLFGHARQIFTPEGNNTISRTTNPALANMMTLTSSPGRATYGGGPPDNRVVHLSDMWVTIREQRDDGSIVVHVGVNDTLVDRDVRWCADSIVLHPPQDTSACAAHVLEKRTVRIDRSLTPTRIQHPDTVGDVRYFSSPTAFTLARGARMRLDRKAALELMNGSTLHLLPGTAITLHRKARLKLDRGARVVVHGDAVVEGTRRQLRKLRRGDRYEHRP